MRKTTSLIIAGLAIFNAATASAQLVQAQPGKTGTIVIAHGGDSLWNSYVTKAAASVHTGGPVAVSFLMGPAAATARFQDEVAQLKHAGATRIVAVPMLVSSHSGHYDQIRYLAGEKVVLDEMMMHHLELSGIARSTDGIPITVTSAMDDSRELAQVLTERAQDLARSVNAAARDRAVLIIGHGPNSAEDYAEWMKALRPIADSVRTRGGFRDVRVELVRDDAPVLVRAEAVTRVRELIYLQAQLTGKDVLVVPVLVSKGGVSHDKVPADIAGTRSVYVDAPLLPHAALVSWIERRVREASASSVSTH